MICPMKQIMNLDSKYIDSYSQKKKKVYGFLQYEMEEKNYWCAHFKQKKKQRNWYFCRDSLQWIHVYS